MTPLATEAPLLEFVTTPDGARLAIKRRPAPGGPPVLFVHGLAVNVDLWDMPPVKTADYEYRSLAQLAHAAGYDVYLLNLRGHGAPRMPSLPPPGQADWCVDHFIDSDLPAAVQYLRDRTGQRPFVIANSMGAMTLAGALLGATIVSGADGEPRVVADETRAAALQAAVRGGVFVEFPAVLRWPETIISPDGRLAWEVVLREWGRNDGDANFAFEMLSRWGWLHALVEAAGQIPLEWLRREGEPWWKALPRPIRETLERCEVAAVSAMLQLAGTFTGATNQRAEVFIRGRRYVMANMKAGVLRQLSKSVRRGAFVSGVGSPDFVYSDHYARIACPALTIGGGRDRIANATYLRSEFHDRIASADKTFLLFENFAHGEFEAAPAATAEVYPRILDWLRART